MGEEVAESWFIDRYEKAGTQSGTFAPDRHQNSSHTDLLIPLNPAQARLASVLCEGKGMADQDSLFSCEISRAPSPDFTDLPA